MLHTILTERYFRYMVRGSLICAVPGWTVFPALPSLHGHSRIRIEAIQIGFLLSGTFHGTTTTPQREHFALA